MDGGFCCTVLMNTELMENRCVENNTLASITGTVMALSCPRIHGTIAVLQVAIFQEGLVKNGGWVEKKSVRLLVSYTKSPRKLQDFTWGVRVGST